MTTSPFIALGLARVINASGKMTALGGTAQTAAIALAQQQAAGHHVDLSQLRKVAGETIARMTGAEAATVTTGAAAGIAIGVAAMITGTDLAAIEQLPDSGDLPDEILLQAGHDIHFGARVVQMIRLGGGQPVPVGHPEGVRKETLVAAISERTAGLLYVQSHHTRQAAGLSLAEMVEIAQAHGLPVLVDAAAEEDLREYVATGADLVTYSGGKAIGGPSVGFITGSRNLIAACELQNRGIARAMKVGKEQISGLLAALAVYPAEPVWPERLNRLHAALGEIPGARISLESDLACPHMKRVGLRLDSVAGLLALVNGLQSGDPAIYTRNHQLEEGLVLFDVREVRDQDIDLLADRVREILVGAARPASEQ